MSLIEFLEEHQGTCFYKEYFGVECPGCGIQRSFILLLKGDVWGSIQLYPPLILWLLLFTFLFAHLIFRFKGGARIIKYAVISVTTITLINYIAKLIFTYYV